LLHPQASLRKDLGRRQLQVELDLVTKHERTSAKLKYVDIDEEVITAT
jgi:hypothetical protein